jgi:hypothetical protein
VPKRTDDAEASLRELEAELERVTEAAERRLGASGEAAA